MVVGYDWSERTMYKHTNQMKEWESKCGKKDMYIWIILEMSMRCIILGKLGGGD